MRSNLVNKPLWFLLIILSGLMTLWFSGQALIGAFKYLQLDARAPAQIHSLKVREVKARYVYEAEYTYEIDKKNYKGKTLFCEPVYLNQLSAESDLEKWKKFSWDVWYNSKCPKESSLQRFFPFKKAIYALLALGIFIYFGLFYLFQNKVEK